MTVVIDMEVPDDVCDDIIECAAREQIEGSEWLSVVSISDADVEDDCCPACPECGKHDTYFVENPFVGTGQTIENWTCYRCHHEFVVEE
jgi:hypothetical protein